MSYSYFLAKLSSQGGPDPATELRSIVEQCRDPEDPTAWFATYHAGLDFHRAGDSICVIFHHPDGSARVEAVVARILPKGSPPEDAAVRMFYYQWRDRLTNWWHLGGKRPKANSCDVVLTRFQSLKDLPGCSWETGCTAAETFTGQAAFAGWKFDETFRPLKWLQDLRGTRPGDGSANDPPATAEESRPFSDGFLAELARGAEPIAGEIAFYEQHLPEWAEHEGKHVLVKDGAEHGFYPSRDEAVREGFRRFGRVPFLVQQVRLDEKPRPLSWVVR